MFSQKIKNIYHLVQAVVSNLCYGFPARNIRIIAVTGTDGKTTTSQMITNILDASGKKTALSSTVNFKIGTTSWVNATKYTTLSSFSVQKFLRKAVRSRCEYAVLEVSSHALDQNRVWGIFPEVAVITNITREHLDYHRTMNEYRKSKKKLFFMAKYGVVNAEMENPNEFLQVLKKKKVAYGKSPESFQGLIKGVENIVAENVNCSMQGSEFFVNGVKFTLKMPGEFNVENALAAISVATVLGIDLQVCSKALELMTGVPGRLEFVENNHGISVLIDYAVTPNALEKLYFLIRNTIHPSSGKVIAVFGACGDRDRGKRPIMGGIVDKYSDIIILTNEDPYYENPEQIIREVELGVCGKEKDKTLFIIPDRRQAIQKAFSLSRSGDSIVITGKGAEETMAIKDTRIPWNDRKAVEEILQDV